MILLNLPFPPSTNALYRNVPRVGRVKTERYKTWLRAAGNEVLATPLEARLPIEGKFYFIFFLSDADRYNKDGSVKRKDGANFIKAAEDLLVIHGLVEDDRLAEGGSFWWSSRVAKGRCEVRVWPFDAERQSVAALPPEPAARQQGAA